MIEKTLEKILEQLTILNSKIPASGGVAEAPKPAAVVNSTSTTATPPTATAPPSGTTRAEVGQALIKLAELDHEAANQVLRDFGATSPALGEIDPAKYGELVARVAERTTALSKKASLL